MKLETKNIEALFIEALKDMPTRWVEAARAELAAYDAELARLKAENAALVKRAEEAEESEKRLGDTISRLRESARLQINDALTRASQAESERARLMAEVARITKERDEYKGYWNAMQNYASKIEQAFCGKDTEDADEQAQAGKDGA